MNSSALSADAADVVYQRLTVDEMRNFIGDTLDGQWLDTSGTWYAMDWEYAGTAVIDPYDSSMGDAGLNGVPCLRYNATIGNNPAGYYMCTFSFVTQCEGLRFWMLPWVDLSRVRNTLLSAYNSECHSDWYVNGTYQTDNHFAGNGASPEYVGSFRLGGGYGSAGVACAPITFTGTSSTVTVSGCQWACGYQENNVTSIYIPCASVGNMTTPPVIDDGSGISSGTVTGTISENPSGGQDINISVETDNSGLISSILNGIKNLFIPSDEQLQAFTTDMQSIADEHLGGLSEAIDIIDTAFDGIDEVTARESITVDTVRIPLLNSQSFTLGGWTIPLKPSTSGGFALLYTAIALLADFFAAFAFLKMCRNKLEIILNPDSEVIESGS